MFQGKQESLRHRPGSLQGRQCNGDAGFVYFYFGGSKCASGFSQKDRKCEACAYFVVVFKVGDEYFSVPDFLADELLKHAKRAVVIQVQGRPQVYVVDAPLERTEVKEN